MEQLQKEKEEGKNIDSKVLVTVWISVFPRAPMLECVSQHGAGERHGILKRWGLVEAHGRGELSTLPLFSFLP